MILKLKATSRPEVLAFHLGARVDSGALCGLRDGAGGRGRAGRYQPRYNNRQRSEGGFEVRVRRLSRVMLSAV